MLQKFRQIPVPLQKQTLIRAGLGAMFLMLLIALLTGTHDIYILLPCASAAVFDVMSAVLLFRTAVSGDYVVINGKCSEVGLTTVKRRTKYLILQTDTCTVRIMLRHRLCKFPPDSAVRLYVTKKTRLYEKDGEQILYTYLAIEINRV